MVTALVLDIVSIIGAKEEKDLEITDTLTWFGPSPGKDTPVRGICICISLSSFRTCQVDLPIRLCNLEFPVPKLGIQPTDI